MLPANILLCWLANRLVRDSEERPAGVKPALSPWQGDRLSLHHGRVLVCRIVNEQEHRERLELSSPHYGCGILAAGRPVQSTTSVGPEGLEPSPGGLRVRCAATSTLIPCSPFCTRREWARRESNPQSDPYKRPALTVKLRAVERRVGPKGLEPSPTGLKVRRAAITPRPQNVGRAYPFQSCLIHACAPRSSGSPGSRTQHYAVISRVRATGPRLPFANVVIRQVGTAGLEPALSCSQGTRAAAALHPVNPVRTGGFEPPISWSPTRRDARLRYVLSQVARAGVEPASTP